MTTDIGPGRWEELRQQWLLAKYHLSRSQKTITAYSEVTARFARALDAHGVAWNHKEPREVAQVARVFLARGPKRIASRATYNQRRAILSSFGHYLMIEGFIDRNPIDLVERMRGKYDERAPDLTEAAWRAAINAINTTTEIGCRDRALIELAGITGKRSQEMIDLSIGHLTPQGNNLLITWIHTKAGQDQDRIYYAPFATSLYQWLTRYYGVDWRMLPKSTPVFVGLSYNGHGSRLTRAGLVYIYQQRLGVRRVHATRHMFAEMALAAGLDITEVQAMMGHADIGTTKRYLTSKFKQVNDLSQRLVAHVSREE